MGELRSFIDRVRGLPEGESPEQEELASWLDPGSPLHERAYAASQLLATGKTRLCFVCAYSAGGFAHLSGMNLDSATVLLVPALIPWDLPAAKPLEAGVILRWLPRMSAEAFIEATREGDGTTKDSISALADDPMDAEGSDAIAMGVYFAHFRGKVDRHTLLLRDA